MKIVHLTPYFPPHIGGVEFHVKGLAEKLAERGHEVKVLTTDIPGGDCDTPVEVQRLRAVPVPYAPVVPGITSKIEKHVEGFDVIHSHTAPPFFSANAPDKPHVMTYHFDFELPGKVWGVDIPSGIRGVVQGLYNRYYGDVQGYCDRIIATTESYADTSPVLEGNDFTVIPNAIDPEQFRFSREKKPFLLYVGRLSTYKGVYDLIDAAAKIIDRTPIEKIKIVGEGEEKFFIKRKISRKPVKIELLGSVSFETLRRLYSEASCTVLPSKSRVEAFGIVQLESLASGTPVVASETPGVKDICGDNGVGLLFEPGNPESLAEAVTDLFSKDLDELGHRGRGLVEEEYGWDPVVRQVEEVYEDLV